MEFGLALSIALNAPLVDRISPDCKFLVMQLLEEVSLKWVVNSLSTGAHILKGKVCQNMMIDVKVSNSKLFHRAVGIVQVNIFKHLPFIYSYKVLMTCYPKRTNIAVRY